MICVGEEGAMRGSSSTHSAKGAASHKTLLLARCWRAGGEQDCKRLHGVGVWHGGMRLGLRS